MALFYNNDLLKPIQDALPKIKEYREFLYNLKHREEIHLAESSLKKGIYVIIIGESQNRERMSVYTYDKNTTPFLVKRKKDYHWIFMENAYACHTHTIPVLTYALTQKNAYNKMSLDNAYSIIDLLSDYNTYWISNQKAVGCWGEPITEIGLHAKNAIFINKSFVKKDPYDSELINQLPTEELLKGKTSIIFIHLMGSHSHYQDRYPKEFEKYTNPYDNSIFYNDYIIEKIYTHFSEMDSFQGIIYFSDHSDDLTCNCHNASNFTWDMIKIPFYFYFSDRYIKNNPEKIESLKKHTKTAFTNDMMFDTILGFLNITDKRFYVPENDILNEKFDHSFSDLTTLHGQKKIMEENNK